MDSTIIGVECIDELADFAGLKAEVAAITEAAMRGELDFEAALIARVALLKGLPARGARGAATPSGCGSIPGRGRWCGPWRRSGRRRRWSRAASASSPSGWRRRRASPGSRRTRSIVADGRADRRGRRGRSSGARPSSRRCGARRRGGHRAGGGAGGRATVPTTSTWCARPGSGVAYHAKPALAAAADARLERSDLTALLALQGIPRPSGAERLRSGRGGCERSAAATCRRSPGTSAGRRPRAAWPGRWGCRRSSAASAPAAGGGEGGLGLGEAGHRLPAARRPGSARPG